MQFFRLPGYAGSPGAMYKSSSRKMHGNLKLSRSSKPIKRIKKNKISALKPGMILTGIVTNITHFGVFVDVGSKKDGLIHVSQLADHFVKDPAEVVKSGQRIQVVVAGVDIEHGHIKLLMKSKKNAAKGSKARANDYRSHGKSEPINSNWFQDALNASKADKVDKEVSCFCSKTNNHFVRKKSAR